MVYNVENRSKRVKWVKNTAHVLIAVYLRLDQSVQEPPAISSQSYLRLQSAIAEKCSIDRTRYVSCSGSLKTGRFGYQWQAGLAMIGLIRCTGRIYDFRQYDFNSKIFLLINFYPMHRWRFGLTFFVPATILGPTWLYRTTSTGTLPSTPLTPMVWVTMPQLTFWKRLRIESGDFWQKLTLGFKWIEKLIKLFESHASNGRCVIVSFFDILPSGILLKNATVWKASTC